MPTDTVVLIHGLWMTPRSWEHWIDRYSARGLNVVAPPWPGHDVEVDALREDPSALEDLTFAKVADALESAVRELDSPPIIMGHSFGGAFTQVLLDRGLGSAGVAIDSAGLRGVLPLPASAIRSVLPVLSHPSNRHKAVELTFEQFRYVFANTLGDQDAQEAYDRYAVPGPGHLVFEEGVANFNPHTALHVDWHNAERAPLLLIAGGEDHLIPPAINEANFKHYTSDAVTEYKEFPGRSHFTVGQPGWEAVADYALEWALKHARVTSG
jgi:alpha-beta hydrolase superfamily lysophospholipase